MAIQKRTIEDFIQSAQQHPVFDVRSPGEYEQAHIPGAYSLPLFSNEERAVVGTAYKQQSREKAIKVGLDYFGTKMRGMVEAVESIVSALPKNEEGPSPIWVHCWRGGMRSAGVAWLLDLYGFKVFTIIGGYKAYRKWVRQQFEKEYHFKIIGGYTGSGKTPVLKELAKQHHIIDLEALANHKGSAFGDMGKQPTQEMFENLLAEALYKASKDNPDNIIFIEDESQRIGNRQIPMPLWYTMRKSPVFFLDVPFEERLDHITEEYSKTEKEKLVNAIIRIQKRLGGLETKNAINFLLEDNYKESFRVLLKYYDKFYNKGLYNRENTDELLHTISCTNVDSNVNAEAITTLLNQHINQ